MEASFEVYFFLTFLTENVHTACLVAQQHHSALPYHAAFIFSCNCLVLSFVLPGSANLALLFNSILVDDTKTSRVVFQNSFCFVGLSVQLFSFPQDNFDFISLLLPNGCCFFFFSEEL